MNAFQINVRTTENTIVPKTFMPRFKMNVHQKHMRGIGAHFPFLTPYNVLFNSHAHFFHSGRKLFSLANSVIF